MDDKELLRLPKEKTEQIIRLESEPSPMVGQDREREFELAVLRAHRADLFWEAVQRSLIYYGGENNAQ